MASCDGSGGPWRIAAGRSKASETANQKGMPSTSASQRWYTDIADIVSERYASDAQMRASLPEETPPPCGVIHMQGASPQRSRGLSGESEVARARGLSRAAGSHESRRTAASARRAPPLAADARIRATTRERSRGTPPPTLRTQSSPTMPFSPIDYQKRARRTHGSQGLFHPRDYP